MIGDLDEKIDNMIVKHEKDFMAAYRVIIFILSIELKSIYMFYIGTYVKNPKRIGGNEKEVQ